VRRGPQLLMYRGSASFDRALHQVLVLPLQGQRPLHGAGFDQRPETRRVALHHRLDPLYVIPQCVVVPPRVPRDVGVRPRRLGACRRATRAGIVICPSNRNWCSGTEPTAASAANQPSALRTAHRARRPPRRPPGPSRLAATNRLAHRPRRPHRRSQHRSRFADSPAPDIRFRPSRTSSRGRFSRLTSMVTTAGAMRTALS
jgi:hypothetical protein